MTVSSWDVSALRVRFIRELVRDEGLTRGLGDIEARMIVDWASGWAELFAQAAHSDEQAGHYIERIGRRARVIVRFVQLWTHPPSRPAASQLAAVERLTGPLPTGAVDPADLMQHVLTWERPGDAWKMKNSGAMVKSSSPGRLSDTPVEILRGVCGCNCHAR